MKVYILSSEHGTFVFSEVVETEGFYLVPVPNTYEYTTYNKKLYKLEIVEAKKL